MQKSLEKMFPTCKNFHGKDINPPLTVKKILEKCLPNLSNSNRYVIIDQLQLQGVKTAEQMSRLTEVMLYETSLSTVDRRRLVEYTQLLFKDKPASETPVYKGYELTENPDHDKSPPEFEEFVQSRAKKDIPSLHCCSYGTTDHISHQDTKDYVSTYNPYKYDDKSSTNYALRYHESENDTKMDTEPTVEDTIVTHGQGYKKNPPAFSLTTLADSPLKGKQRESYKLRNSPDSPMKALNRPSSFETNVERFETILKRSEESTDTEEQDDGYDEPKPKNIETPIVVNPKDKHMSELKRCVESVFPNLSVAEQCEVLRAIADLGVEELGDLELVKESDLNKILKPIQVRKLLKYARENKESVSNTVTQNTDENLLLNLDVKPDEKALGLATKKPQNESNALYSDILKTSPKGSGVKSTTEVSGAVSRDTRSAGHSYEFKSEPIRIKKIHCDPKQVNILILGETGVGKSTLINAFANYIKYSSLEEAERAPDLCCLIPTRFAVTDLDYSERLVRFGSDPNESGGKAGSSQTQSCRDYDFEVGQTKIRLIDTPGIGDTSGVDQDAINFKRIIDHIQQYSHLNAILILLKPNNARLTVLFRFCIQELLNHLHKKASKNIVFLFTNARSTFFRPGDSLPALRSLLKDNQRHYTDFEVKLEKDTIYCVDNEPFRFLVALMNKVRFTAKEKENFVTSWINSSVECKRLISYVTKLTPHIIEETASLYEVKLIASLLTRPLCDCSLLIHRNQQEFLAMEKRINSAGNNRVLLHKEAYFNFLDCKIDYYDTPITVCLNVRCVNTSLTVDPILCQYSTVCYDPAFQKPRTERSNNRLHLECRTHGGTKYCENCGCRFDEHAEIYYENRVYLEKKKLVDATMGLTRDREHEEIAKYLSSLDKKVKEETDELYTIVIAMAKLSFFMRINAITVQSDDVMERIDHLIEVEKLKNVHRTFGNDAKSRINHLEWLKDRYQRYLEDWHFKYAGEAHRIFTPEKMQEVVEDLYAMKHYGTYIKKAVQGQLSAMELKRSSKKWTIETRL